MRKIAIAAQAPMPAKRTWGGLPSVLHPVAEDVVSVLETTTHRRGAAGRAQTVLASAFDRLRGEGFPDHIIEALQLATKRDGEDYEALVRQSDRPPRRQRGVVDCALLACRWSDDRAAQRERGRSRGFPSALPSDAAPGGRSAQSSKRRDREAGDPHQTGGAHRAQITALLIMRCRSGTAQARLF
jgi:hypothetical protein